MALTVNSRLQDAETARRMKADILLSQSGSWATMDALAHAAYQHYTTALRDADTDLASHWNTVHAIFMEARDKIGALK